MSFSPFERAAITFSSEIESRITDGITCQQSSVSGLPHFRLLDGDALREIARFVDVAAELDGEVVGEQLQRDDGQDRADVIGDRREA